jgi:hypothetical protein
MEHAKNTCQLLEWLGLVEPDSTSPFGYRPTQDLIGIILKRGLRRPGNVTKRTLSCEDAEIMETVREAWRTFPIKDTLPRLVFGVLGLTNVNDDLEEIPTPKLRELVAKRRRADREKSRGPGSQAW